MDLCGRLADGGGNVKEGHLKCLSPSEIDADVAKKELELVQRQPR